MKKTSKIKFNRSAECAKIIRQRISGGSYRKTRALARGDSFINELKFDKNGLIPAVIQDYKTKDVLMVAYMNRESLKVTLREGKTCFWSRSRKKFWTKGETSGCFQFVKGIYYDCDMDCLLIKVRQKGVACHTGEYSCFFRKIK